MNLLELQRRMSEDVMRPLTHDFAMQAAQGLPSDEIQASYIKPNSFLTSFERLEIYNRQYWFRVIDAVSEDYPGLRAVLGRERFNSLVLAYLRENPSRSFTLRDIGGRLPAWLASYPDLAGPQHALAVDVARLEWAYIEAFDGATLMPLGAENFADLGRDSTLRLQPHLQLLDLQYPVDDVVLAVHKGSPAIDIVSNAVPERRQASEVTLPEVSRFNIYLAVHRFEDSVYYLRIEREEFLLLADLRDGDSIATAIERAFEGSKLAPDLQAARIQNYFAHASELGWFCLPESAKAKGAQPKERTTLSAAAILTMNKAPRALIAGLARLHANSLTEYGSEVARPCVEVTVRELIDRCDGSVRFSVKVVCANLHLSQSQMAQKFKSRYHKTILEYWSEVRLNRARALLSKRPARSVGSIATELGYQHPNNFTNWFTRQMGISPRQYIASVQSGAFPASTFPGQLVEPSKLKSS